MSARTSLGLKCVWLGPEEVLRKRSCVFETAAISGTSGLAVAFSWNGLVALWTAIGLHEAGVVASCVPDVEGVSFADFPSSSVNKSDI
eukprot:scaffold104672_cov36-Prasinocladus_malaysianus.AAC.2